MHLLAARKGGVILLTISANRGAQYNIHTAAAAVGDTTVSCNVVLTINSGIYVGNSARSSYGSLYTGTGWVAGSTITLINGGSIEGYGGNANGGNGGRAIYLDWPIIIDNTGGYIFGGGGGGGHGGTGGPGIQGGGGGGGGKGNPGGYGGAAPAAQYKGVDGYDGNRAGPGGGGAGYWQLPGVEGGDGGRGGGWGNSGNAGGTAWDGVQGTAGGNAGHAIYLNGYSVTWLGGNNSTQVKGTVA